MNKEKDIRLYLDDIPEAISKIETEGLKFSFKKPQMNADLLILILDILWKFV